MWQWLKRIFARKKANDEVQEAINSLHTATNKNRNPLDPDSNPWQT